MSEDSFHLGIKALIRNTSGQILLLQVNPAKLHGQRRDYWDLPGGRIQKEHTVLDTLRREVEEETGVSDISNCEPLGMVLSNIRIPIGNDSVGLVLSVYSCTIPSDATITISDEHIASRWFLPAEAAKLLAIKYPEDFCQLISNLSEPGQASIHLTS